MVFVILFWLLLSDYLPTFFTWTLVTRLPIFNCPGLRIRQNVALGLGNVFPKFLARNSLKNQRKSMFFMLALRIFLRIFQRIPIQRAPRLLVRITLAIIKDLMCNMYIFRSMTRTRPQADTKPNKRMTNLKHSNTLERLSRIHPGREIDFLE